MRMLHICSVGACVLCKPLGPRPRSRDAVASSIPCGVTAKGGRASSPRRASASAGQPDAAAAVYDQVLRLAPTSAPARADLRLCRHRARHAFGADRPIATGRSSIPSGNVDACAFVLAIDVASLRRGRTRGQTRCTTRTRTNRVVLEKGKPRRPLRISGASQHPIRERGGRGSNPQPPT